MCNGEDVPQVTGQRFVFWNSGNTTLLGSQVVASAPFCIDLSGRGKMLSAEIVTVTREVNEATCVILSSSPNQIILNYDFLDRNDGFVVDVMHSGSANNLMVKGTLRSLHRGVTYLGHINIRDVKNRVFLLLFLVFEGLLFTIEFLSPPLRSAFPILYEIKPRDPTKVDWFLVSVSLANLAQPSHIMWSRRRIFPNTLNINEKI